MMLGSNNESNQLALKTSSENIVGNKKNDHWCDFCNRDNHTRETCWRINRLPHMDKKNQKGKN